MSRSGRAAPAALRRRERPSGTATLSPQRPGTGCGSVRGRLPLGKQRPSLLASGRRLPRGSGGLRAELGRVRPAGSRGAAAAPRARRRRRPPRALYELSPRSPRAPVPALPCPRRALSPPGGAVPAPLRDAVWEWLWRWGWLKEAASRGLMSAMLAVAY